jgi:hypothetical protein
MSNKATSPPLPVVGDHRRPPLDNELRREPRNKTPVIAREVADSTRRMDLESPGYGVEREMSLIVVNAKYGAINNKGETSTGTATSLFLSVPSAARRS